MQEFLRPRLKTGKLTFTAFLLAKACHQSSSGSRDGERIQSDIAKGVNIARPEKFGGTFAVNLPHVA